MELISIKEWCEKCTEKKADNVLVDNDDTIFGWYCKWCGARVKERLTEHRKPRAHCHFNENSNRQCLLDDKHTGDHNLPCIESAAHEPHAKDGVDADGLLYQCRGQRFDLT